MNDTALQFAPYVILLVLTMIPGWKLTTRLGISPTWILFMLLPFFGLLIFFWVVAFLRWGVGDATSETARA
ncbi:MAG TPA: hypothetical protein VGR70_10395 [Stellaceae bacterium]|nr:hypothetical protein [Stellaceae bacterium]